MRKDKLPCGCVSEHGAERWLHLCDQHQAEYDERHRQAAKDLAERRARDEAIAGI